MARFVQVGGQTTGVPGVRQDYVRAEGGGSPGFLESGVVAILGECAGTIQPGIVHEYRSPQKLKGQLRSGALYDASRFAFSPSREDPLEVSGAQKVLAMRVNPATQGTLELDNASAALLITLTSRAYGAIAADLSGTVAAGTLGGPGKKLTISQRGEADEVGDNLGFSGMLLVRHKGTGSAVDAQMTLSPSTFTTDVNTGSGFTGDLSIDLSVYDTVAKLVSQINASANYEAVTTIPNPEQYACADLDFVTNQNIFTINGGTVTIADAVTTAMTMDDLTAGNVVRLGSGASTEYVYLSAVANSPSTNTVIRAYLDSNPIAHTAVNADEFAMITGVNKAMVDWVNGQSARATAARNTSGVVGTPAALSQTFFSSAAEGTTTNSDWTAAFEELRNHRVNFIVVLSSSSTVHGYLADHLTWRWGKGGSEAQGFVGAATDETLPQLKARAKALNDANISLHFQDVNRDNDLGVDTNYAPWAMAVLDAAIRAGSAFGVDPADKALNITAIGQNSNIDLIDDADALIEYGICHARYYDDEYRFVRCLTTYTTDDTDFKIEPTVRRSVAWTLHKVRYNLRRSNIAGPAKRGNANAIKSTITTTLEEIRDVDGAITEGSQIVNGRQENIPAFSDVLAFQTGNVADASYKFVPTGSTLFINVGSVVGVFRDSA